LLLLTTQVFLSLLAVVAAYVSWRQASAVTQLRKRITSLETDILDQASKLDRMYELAKSLSQRQALADNRHKRLGGTQVEAFNDVPGPNATKDELRDFYLRGKTHTEVARLVAKGPAK